MATSSATHLDLDKSSPALATRAARRLSILGFVSVILTKAVAFQLLDILAGNAKMRRQRRRDTMTAGCGCDR